MTTSIHAQAFNFARRNSIRNENDLLQENLFDDDDTFEAVTEKYCVSLLEKHLPPGFEMPSDCQKYRTFRVGLQRRESNRQDESIAFQGMNPNEALEARRAREQGRPHHAKVVRRMTTNNPQKPGSSWF